jgi:hypothetical protein
LKPLHSLTSFLSLSSPKTFGEKQKSVTRERVTQLKVFLYFSIRMSSLVVETAESIQLKLRRGPLPRLANSDQCYKSFYGRNLQIYVISWSVSPWQAFPD